MPNDQEVSKKRTNEEEPGVDLEIDGKVPNKKVKESVPVLAINALLEDTDYLDKLKHSWGVEDFDSPDCPPIKFATLPFPHGEISDILVDPSVLIDLQKSLHYDEKSSDLFHFHQSGDLRHMTAASDGHESAKAICNFLETKVFEAIKHITGLPLNGTFDAFASRYQMKDHLLCHDDELDSRRIAFIIYMSKEWQEEYAGTLDFFDSIETGHGGLEPGVITKSISPSFNKLAFFEVTAKSFHQVREVVSENASRFAISGWYYGEPLPRPAIQLPEEVYISVDFPERSEAQLAEYLDKPYLDSETMKTVNQKLTENSEILLSKFLQPSLYTVVVETLNKIKDSQWTLAGPANLQNFLQLKDTDAVFPHESLKFFKSKDFLEFLQELTEFPFASEPELRFSCSLKKFQRGSYTLIRGKERHYQKSEKRDSSIEVMSDSEEEDEADDNEEAIERLRAETNNDVVYDENIPQSSVNGIEAAISDHDHNNSDIEGDDEEGGDMINDMSDDSEGEEADEPNRIDLMYFIIPDVPSDADHNGDDEDKEDEKKQQDDNSTELSSEKKTEPAAKTNGCAKDLKWDDSWGGNRIYTDGISGKQLINVVPEANALAIVVRDDAINSHFSYVNCLAKDRTFYCFDFEFNFPQTTNK